MPLISPFHCYRGNQHCEPLHAIEGTLEPMTEEHFEDPAFVPDTFVCCGICHDDHRKLAQDAYCLCFKSHGTDDITYNDEQDLTHLLAVISQALAVIATRRVNSGMIEVPTMQGMDEQG